MLGCEEMQKKRNWMMLVLLIVSFGINIFLLGKWLVFERLFEPTSEEKIILSEMVQKTVESADFKNLAEKEKIIAIDTSVNKFKGGVYPFYLEVGVKTDTQTYLFYCTNAQCSKVENGGYTYSIYEDESTRLPLKTKGDAK